MLIYELSIDDLNKSEIFFPVEGQEELLLDLAENKITNGISAKDGWIDLIVLKKEPQIDADFYDVRDSGIVILSPKAYKLISPLLNESVETLKLRSDDGDYYLLNVIEPTNCLDIENSVCTILPSGQIMDYQKLVKTSLDSVKNRYANSQCDKINKDQFIDDLNTVSKNIFYKVKMFAWTITSDGYDYAPGGIGCCSHITIPEKRQFLKEKFANNMELPSATDEVANFHKSFYTQLTDDMLNDNEFCVAGEGKNIYKISLKRPRQGLVGSVHQVELNDTEESPFQERENIEQFEYFKDDPNHPSKK